MAKSKRERLLIFRVPMGILSRMNDLPIAISTVKASLEGQFPLAEVLVDAPSSKTGLWWIDVRAEGRQTAFSWQQGAGYGFYPEDEVSFGARPEILVESSAEAVVMAAKLIGAMGQRHATFVASK